MNRQKKISYSADIEYVDDEGEGIIVGWNNAPDSKPDGIRNHLIVIFPKNPPADDRQRYAEGDKITVVKTITLERKSLTPIYLLPMTLVGSLLLLLAAGATKGVAGVATLGILALYGLGLLLFRHKLYRETSYRYHLVDAPQGKANSSASSSNR
jgi:hypothetical protein